MQDGRVGRVNVVERPDQLAILHVVFEDVTPAVANQKPGIVPTQSQSGDRMAPGTVVLTRRTI